MRFIYLLLLIFFLTEKTFAQDGKNNLQLSEQTVNSFIRYIKGDTSISKSAFNKPLYFWVSIDGSHSAWWYCPFERCAPSTGAQEKKACEKGTNLTCARFARGRYVRWDNGINPKGKKAKFNSKMTDNEIRSKLTSLGFYNNNTITSSGNDSLTKTSDINNKNLTIDQQLENLSKLYKDGVLTKEEFKSAKKKILNLN